MDFLEYSFYKLAFMLQRNQFKWKRDILTKWICEFIETWAVKQRDIKGHIKSH